MLNSVLKELNNYFTKRTSGVLNYSFSVDSTFTAPATIAGDFTDTFIAGEYIIIQGTRINDGVYLITSINDSSITIDTDVDISIKTEPEVTSTLTKAYIPPELIELIAEIKDYNDNNEDGLASEKQGNRSVSYGAVKRSGWKNAFGSRLSPYKKVRWL